MTNATSNYQVIIVGAGFAGVAAARRLGKAKIPTLLIDRNNYSQFQPLLYQVASSQLPPSDVAEPLRAIFRKRPSVRVLTAEVTAIDAAAHTVTVDDGTVYSAQTLVIAAGAVVNFFGTPGAAEHAYPLYSVSDSTRLGAAIIEQFDKADARVAAGEALDPTNIIVVGAGPTGVEMAGAIAETVNTVVPRTYSDAVREAFTVHLADLAKTVLGPFTEELQQYAQEHLEELGVQLHLGTSVKEVRADGVTLSDGEVLAAPIVIWAGGLHAQPVVGQAGITPGRGGRLDVNDDLTVPGFPGVYALGDAANIPDGAGKTLPGLGAVAKQAGAWAGENILADLKGKQRSAFDYHDRGFMAMIGRMAAVAEVGKSHKQLHGPLAFAGWLAVHDVLLPSARPRYNALVNWVRDYFTEDRTEFIVGDATRN